MSENETGEAARDGAGQALRVGDQVAGVRLDPTHTVRGEVLRLGAETCTVGVTWVSNPHPGLGSYARARRAGVGSQVRLHLARTFRLGAGTDAGEGASERVAQLEGQLQASLRREFEGATRSRLAGQLARMLGLVEGTPWLASLATVAKLRSRVDELGGYVGAGVTQGDGLGDETGTVLSREGVRERYRTALDATFAVAMNREGAIAAMTDAVMGVRDRELRLLRQRLDLASQLHVLGLEALAGQAERDESVSEGEGHPADFSRFPVVVTPAQLNQFRETGTVPVPMTPTGVDETEAGGSGGILSWERTRTATELQASEDAILAAGDADAPKLTAHPAGCRCNDPYPCGRAGEGQP